MNVFEEAVAFAVEAHEGMVRKSEHKPYILHPLEVAVIAATMTDDLDVMAAAVLHDVVEDTPHTMDEIRSRFGARVAELVAAETENKRRDRPSADTWRVRKEESLADLEASDRDVMIVWLADKLSNMRSLARVKAAQGAAMWEAFNQKDTYQQAWYYSTIAELIRDELGAMDAWQEYDRLTHYVFEEELA